MVVAVPNNDPCVPEDENTFPACVVFADAWEVTDANKDDGDVTVVDVDGFVVNSAVDGVDDGIDGWDDIGVLNIKASDEGVEVGDPKNGCDFDTETKIYQN